MNADSRISTLRKEVIETGRQFDRSAGDLVRAQLGNYDTGAIADLTAQAKSDMATHDAAVVRLIKARIAVAAATIPAPTPSA